MVLLTIAVVRRVRSVVGIYSVSLCSLQCGDCREWMSELVASLLSLHHSSDRVWRLFGCGVMNVEIEGLKSLMQEYIIMIWTISNTHHETNQFSQLSH